MTSEEAAEIILSGRYREKCNRCKGEGVVSTGDGNWLIECAQCSGSGYKLNRDYELAYKHLKLPLPALHEDNWDGTPHED